MDKKIYTLDRFEGEYAVLIDKNAEALDIPVERIPQSAREGDAIVYDGESFIIDEELTVKKREDIKNRFNKLKKKA